MTERNKYREHAFVEFKAAGWLNADGKFNDPMQGMIFRHVLKLLDVFHDEHHSGTSAPYAVNLFKRLAMFETIAPLTGAEDEWIEYRDGGFQNRRCSHVFKDKDRFDGQAYDSEGKIFVEVSKDEDGKERRVSFTSRDSRVPVTFPYTPKREYVELHK